MNSTELGGWRNLSTPSLLDNLIFPSSPAGENEQTDMLVISIELSDTFCVHRHSRNGDLAT